MKKLNEGFTYQVEEGYIYQPGVKRTDKGICFTVAVPDGKRCSLLLYKRGEEEVAASIPMGSSVRYGDLRSLLIEGLPIEEYEYNYLIDGKVVTDPYAAWICGREQWGEEVPAKGKLRGRAVLEEYDWEGDTRLHIPYEDVIAYAAHVRGFTKHPSSRVRAKGTFAGIREKIPYLKELGINQLELMPVYEFSELPVPEDMQDQKYRPFEIRQERLNYWGYTEGFYFAPKASYSAAGNPVREMKDLVKDLHRNGIELILEFYFPKGTRASLIADCMKYWVLEYHIDGVHINRDQVPAELLAQEPLLSHIKIMTESFRLEEIYQEGYTPSYRNLGEYNDGFMLSARRFLKGDEAQLQEFTWRVRRNPEKCGVMNYLANHNGFTMMDMVSYDEKHNEANGEDNRDGTDYNCSWNCGEEGPSRKKKVVQLRLKQLRNAFVFLFLSQGTPLIFEGDERGNSQSGNNNAYCQDNELAWMNWKMGKAESFLPEYVKALIAFRKAHPVFCQAKEMRRVDYLSCGYPDLSYHGKRAWYGDFETGGRAVGILYAGDYIEANSHGEQKDEFFYVAYNMYSRPYEFALPGLPGNLQWKIAIDTGKEGMTGICPEGQEINLEEQRTVMVPERTVQVLIGR